MCGQWVSAMQEYNEFPLNFIKLCDMIMQFANNLLCHKNRTCCKSEINDIEKFEK